MQTIIINSRAELDALTILLGDVDIELSDHMRQVRNTAPKLRTMVAMLGQATFPMRLVMADDAVELCVADRFALDFDAAAQKLGEQDYANYQALFYAQHSKRFDAALQKVRKVKNHGPRGKWGKLK